MIKLCRIEGVSYIKFRDAEVHFGGARPEAEEEPAEEKAEAEREVEPQIGDYLIEGFPSKLLR